MKFSQNFLNTIEEKLTFGDLQTNTALGTSNGTEGLFPSLFNSNETPLIGYTNIDIAKMYEIVRQSDITGTHNEYLWLADMYQRQAIDEGMFATFPAGAWVWGSNERSQEAMISYGTQSIKIGGKMFNIKKHMLFSTEYRVGKTPNASIGSMYADFGVLMPMGTTQEVRGRQYKHITVMERQPTGGGTIMNGIRAYSHGGSSNNPTTGTFEDKVEVGCYRGIRVCGKNQFILLKK
jgi:hypothetical protein